MSATSYRLKCIICDHSPTLAHSPYCPKCSNGIVLDVRASVARVLSKAIREGVLPSAKTRICVDCGAGAFDYDHRDYSKPLTVDPVCRRCNQLRGPADWSAYREAKREARV